MKFKLAAACLGMAALSGALAPAGLSDWFSPRAEAKTKAIKYCAHAFKKSGASRNYRCYRYVYRHCPKGWVGSQIVSIKGAGRIDYRIQYRCMRSPG